MMILDYSKIIGKHVKIVCIFGDIKNPIYYDGSIVDYDKLGRVLTITDKFGRTVFIDADSVKQVALD